MIDGKVPGGISDGIPAVATAREKFAPGPLRPVPVKLNQDTLTVLTYPLEAGHVVIAEFP